MNIDTNKNSIIATNAGINNQTKRPTREEAEDAVRTLIAWAGDDPKRKGLLDTPQRVIDAYREFFSGYGKSAFECLSKTFDTTTHYNGIVLLRDIDIYSHCEHHMVPFIGQVHVAYYPVDRIVGLSKLVRMIEIITHRLQTQEVMTAEIANTIQNALNPHGVAVVVEAIHQCMSLRGVKKNNVATVTVQFLGRFENSYEQDRFMSLIKS